MQLQTPQVCDFGYSKQDERAAALSKVGTLGERLGPHKSLSRCKAAAAAAALAAAAELPRGGWGAHMRLHAT